MASNPRSSLRERLAGLSRLVRAIPGRAASSTQPVAPSPAPPGSVRPGGTLLRRTVQGPWGGLDYDLYVPSGYNAETPVPLVVMLHGCTQSAADVATGTRLNQLADAETFLVAYPKQSRSANPSRCWNWFQAAHQRRGKGEPALIAGLTRRIMADHRVDPDAVYVAGISAGGAMAAIVGTQYPDLYAAVGVHSGLAPGAARGLRSGLAAMRDGGPMPARGAGREGAAIVPTIVFHGDRDATVNPRNGELVVAAALRFPAADPGGAGITVESSTGPIPGASPGRYSYTRTIYRDREGRALGEHWLVHGLGHAWSGGSPGLPYSDPRGPDASREMLRFFREHRRPESLC